MPLLAAIVGASLAVGCSSHSSLHRPSPTPIAPPDADPPQAADASLSIGGGVIGIDIEGANTAIPPTAIRAWIQTAARAITHYFGRFPVKRVDITVTLGGDGKIEEGKTFDGRWIHVRLGSKAGPADLDADWVMTHEMFHLAFPDLDEKYLWMNEGLSTYLEPFARARIGTLTPQFVWLETVQGLPNGLPESGDQGLDNTHTWGRTYWGGEMFWLLADIKIRKQTANRKSLDDAIHAILDAGGDGSEHWELNRVFEVGDRATGTTVLKDLHDQMGYKAVTPDLDAFWKDMGVIVHGDQIKFDDAAPLAAIRRSMTSP